ncbi:MAG: methyltransferase domain-containing protein [Chitinophagaceae bacterium]
MQIARIRNLSDYKDYKTKNAALSEVVWLKEKKMADAMKNTQFTIRGFSYPAEAMVDFQVDYLYSNGLDINWRERVVCPVTGLNNRLRGCIHLIDFELGLRPYHDIYMAEQATPLYTYLKAKFPRLIGSEYLRDNKRPGFVDDRKLRHESVTDLSFKNESMDAYLSFECFEHIPDFKKAFAEAARILKPGGKFIWSVPFADQEHKNIIRSYVDENGEVQHILEPQYSGDHVSSKGILCFTHFGWEMLDQVRNEGFDDAYAFLYRSEVFGYLGGEQILFIAEKYKDNTGKKRNSTALTEDGTEKINCLFCNSNNATLISKRADIVTCSGCGITYLRTRPTQEKMYQIYQGYANDTSHMRPPDTKEDGKNAGLRRKYLIDEITGIGNRQGVWLDVGCGWGALLDEVRSRGYTPKGIEITRNCQDFATSQLQIPVSNAQFTDAKIDAGSCAVVSMVHVLEHLPYPKQALDKVYNILEPGGMFCGIVPNIESICSEYLKDDWVWLDPQHHYVHYSPRTLTEVLKKAGFTVIRMYTSVGDYDYNAVVDCIRNNMPGISTPDMVKELIPQLEASGKGEEIRFFVRKDNIKQS